MLPIRRVVLFKHGVGFFQRSGEVEGDAVIELGFKAGQMNDVLKSLTALDLGGGTFAALSYDSEEPLERRLSELNLSIPEKGAVSAFLDRVKGARISVPRGDGDLTGTVMGIEEVKTFRDRAAAVETHLAILAEGTLVRIPLAEVDRLTFLDESVRRDLETLLDLLFSGLRKDLKRLTLQARGEGRRDVSVSYVVESPVWKTSYRIMLPEGGEGAPLLQGWALVDNTTEDDWKDVKLGLVAGLPISFVHDLYTPRYRSRPVVEVEEEAAVAPPVVESGMLKEEYVGAELEEMVCEVAPPMPAAMGALKRKCAPAPSLADAARTSTEVHTRTREVGDLFAYDLSQPVDIPRSRSALVPILQAEPGAERVALYNASIREENPMTAFRLENDTGLTLEGGPVTVFEGDGYVGEAMLDTLRDGDKCITPYSVELGMIVREETSTRSKEYAKATMRGAYLRKHYRRMRRTEYTVVSRLSRAVKLYIDHPFRYERFAETPEPEEITDSYWRFLTEIPPRKTEVFTVDEVEESFDAIEVRNLAITQIHGLAKDKLISDAAAKRLEAVARQVAAVEALQRELSEAEAAGESIIEDQDRLRKNLKALGATSDEARLRKRYVKALDDGETALSDLKKKVESLKTRIQAEEEKLDDMVERLNETA